MEAVDTTKICPRCKKDYPRSEFRAGYCIECSRAYHREYQRKLREELSDYYVMRLMFGNMLPLEVEVSPDYIETKRMLLKAQRYVRKTQKEQKIGKAGDS
jgi:hypothetical protein